MDGVDGDTGIEVTLLPGPGMHCPTCTCNKPPRKDRKLTPEHVRQIRHLSAKGFSAASLSKSYGVAVVVIEKVINRETYKEIV